MSFLVDNMNKKAMTEKTVVRLILVVAALVVIFIVANTILGLITSKADVVTFRAKAQMAMASKTAGSTMTSIPTERVNILVSDDKYKIGKQKAEYKTLFDEDTLNKEVMNKILAQQMDDCWYKLLGDLDDDPFDHEFLGTENVCYVCGQVSLDERAKKVFKGTLLANTHLKNEKSIYDKEQSYWEYFNADACEENHGVNILPPGGVLDFVSSPTYAIVFYSTTRGFFATGDDRDWVKDPLAGKYDSCLILQPITEMDLPSCKLMN